MATEVPFHSTFGKAFLSEAEAEARTAVCTKLSLEQLDQEPFFRARLFVLKARKFVADRFARDDEADDVPAFDKKTNNSYFAFFCILLLALYCGLSIVKHGLDNPVLSVRDGVLSSLGLQHTATRHVEVIPEVCLPCTEVNRSVFPRARTCPQTYPRYVFPSDGFLWCCSRRGTSPCQLTARHCRTSPPRRS